MAFKVFKIKVNLISANIYLTFFEIIWDVKNVFGKFDKIAKSDTFLYELKFVMAIANAKKTFNTFFTKFSSAIASLDFINWYKISNL